MEELMRDSTSEEQKQVQKQIDTISKPTGETFYDEDLKKVLDVEVLDI